jgi:hypothetical protein
MNKCYKKCRESGLQYTNGLSTKMIQASIINTNGKNKAGYNNSKTNTINASILSGDYNTNKKLLLLLCYRTYIKYFEPLSIVYPNIVDVLNQIIINLTDAEYNKVFETKTLPPPIVPLKTAEIIQKTYYVVCNNIKQNFSYFIFKNMTMQDTFLPTYSYKFDVSDISNRNNILSFSPEKDYKEYSHIERIGVPGVDSSASVILTFPFDLSYNTLYVYNKALTANVVNKLYAYKIGGYTQENITIILNTVSAKMISRCKGNQDVLLAIQPFIPKPYVIPNRDEYTPIKCLTQSSIFTVNNYNGLNIHVYDVKDKTSSLFYNSSFYGLSIGGEYYIHVPKLYQLAFLNKNQTTNFIYSGDNSKKTTYEVIGTENDGIYDFYYGTIKITINGSFQDMSVYTLRFGYLGGYQRFVYTDKCVDVVNSFGAIPDLIRF